MPRRVLVIGGGWAGCAAALALSQKGWRVALVERTHALGGRARGLSLRGLALDNGQHLFLGAYTHTQRLLKALGQGDAIAWQPRLEVPYLLPQGRMERLRCGGLPSALGLLQGLAGCGLLNRAEKRQALALGLWAGPELLQSRLGHAPASLEGLSAAQWLAGRGQGAGVIAKLWEPLGLAACNAPLDQAPAGLLASVLAQGFLQGGATACLGFSKRPLSRLLDAIPACLAAQGGECHLGLAAKTLEWERGRFHSLELADGRRLSADALVLALSAREAAGLLGEEKAQALGLAAAAALPSSAIVSAYAVADGPLLPAGFGAFVEPQGGQPSWHWGFDKGPCQGGHLHCFVASAAQGLARLQRPALLESLHQQLGRYLPPFRPQALRQVLFIAEARATPRFPLSQAPRPGQATAMPDLALAGDWTDTGLPATLEGAVRSGFAAAQAIA